MKECDQEGRTLVHCPDCRRPTFTYVGYGDVAVWCRHCERTFEVLIKPSEAKKDANQAVSKKS